MQCCISLRMTYAKTRFAPASITELESERSAAFDLEALKRTTRTALRRAGSAGLERLMVADELDGQAPSRATAGSPWRPREPVPSRLLPRAPAARRPLQLETSMNELTVRNFWQRPITPQAPGSFSLCPPPMSAYPPTTVCSAIPLATSPPGAAVRAAQFLHSASCCLAHA